jgi:hypothetical protein
LTSDVGSGKFGVIRAQLSGSVANLVGVAFISRRLRQASIVFETGLLVSFLVENVKVGVDTSVLEMSLLKEFNALGRQLPTSLFILISLLKFAILLSLGRIAARSVTNSKVGSSDVVCSKGSQISVQILAIIISVLVILHGVRS